MPDGVGTLHKVSGDLEGKYSTTNINIGYKLILKEANIGIKCSNIMLILY